MPRPISSEMRMRLQHISILLIGFNERNKQECKLFTKLLTLLKEFQGHSQVKVFYTNSAQQYPSSETRIQTNRIPTDTYSAQELPSKENSFFSRSVSLNLLYTVKEHTKHGIYLIMYT